MISFFRNLLGVKADGAVNSAIEAIVRWDPQAATEAELRSMEQNLDQLGLQVAQARASYDKEKREADAIMALSTQRMAAAEQLNARLAAEADPANKTALEGSLVTLVAMLEKMAPDIEREKQDAIDAEAFLRQLEDAGQPLAVYGPYRGEFDFYGRLADAPISLPDRDAALAWARANPAGVIVSYFDGSPLRLPALPYYRGVARDRWVAIWPTSAVTATDGATLNSNF